MNINSFELASVSLFRRRLIFSIGFGTRLVLLLLSPSARASGTQIISFTNPAPIIINGNFVSATPYPVTNFVNLPSANITKVTVSLFGLTDPSTGGNGGYGGLDVLLAGPVNDSPAVNLMWNAGLYGKPVSNINLTMDDAASLLFSSSSAVTNAAYQPSGLDSGYGLNPAQTTNKLAGFIGAQLNGVWGLYIYYEDFFAAGSISGGWSLNFYFVVNPPTATTLAATQVGGADATLNASVNPGGGNTSVYFEYGLDTNYGSFSGTNLVSNNLNSLQTASVNLTGLSPQTTYHFQAIAVNAAGTNFGGDQTVVTTTGSGSGSGPPPTLAESLSNGVPILTLAGTVGVNYAIQYSTSLANPINWITLTNLTLTSTVETIYPGPAASQAVFFRAIAESSVVTPPAAPTLGESFSNGIPVLTLSGTVGGNYAVQYATSLANPINWITLTNLTLTSAVETIYPGPAASQAVFFRAIAEGGGVSAPTAPSLQMSLNSNYAPVMSLSGIVGSNYVVQIATSLANPVTWSPFTNLTLTSAVQLISPVPATNQMEFFRAIMP